MIKHLIILFLLLTTSLTWGDETRLLDLGSLPHESREAVLNRIPALKSPFFTLEHLDSAVRLLMSAGKFERVQVVQLNEDHRTIYKLEVKLSRKFASLILTGAEAVRKLEVEEIFGVNPGSYLKASSLKILEQKLLDLYQSKGYLQTKVAIKTIEADGQGLQVLIQVKEGAPCLISTIRVNSSNDNIKKILASSLRSYHGLALSTNNLTSVENAANLSLWKNKYLRSSVRKVNVKTNDTRDSASLDLDIDNPNEFILVFRGNHYFSSNELKKALELSSDPRSMDNPSSELSDQLRSFYRQNGFANAEITATEILQPTRYRQIITFKITENFRVRINSIDTSGRISQPPEFYEDFIRSHSSDLVEKGYYAKTDIDTGLSELETELRNNGYLRAKVLSVRTQSIDNGRAINVSLTLDEGPLTIIRKITFVGNKSISNTELEKIINIAPNEPLRLKGLAESLALIKKRYLDFGFLEVNIPDKNVVDYSQNGTQAAINIVISEGPKIVVSSIVTEGNSFTKNYVILNEIDFKPGDVLTPDRIEESITRLQRMGIFSRVNIRTLEEGSNLSERTVIVQVTERDPGILNFGIGFNTENEFTTRLYTGLSYRNINGTARVVSSRLELNSNVRTDQVEHRLSISYIEPFIFDDRTRGRTNIIRSKEVTRFDEVSDLPYLHEDTEIEFYLDREYTKHFKVLWKLIGFGTTSDYLKDATPEVRNVARTGPILEFDYRDDQVAPTAGSLSRLTLEYSDPIIGSSPTVAYFKSTVSLTHYYSPLPIKNLVWANSVRGGYLKNLSRDPTGGVPEIENFFLGGRQTIRGFAFDERFPSDSALGLSTGEEFKLQTMSTFYLLKSELRIPITDVIGFSLFYDGGAVNIEGLTLADPYRDAAGVGLNFQTPVGPLNFELGYKLDRKPDEVPYAIHLFTFGYF